jgi:hypothetical protein
VPKLILLATLVALALAGAAGGETAASKQIASATTTDFRVAVVAQRTGAGSAPTARVTLTTYERAGGRWQKSGTHRVGGSPSWFWNTVTGPRALCRFELVTRRGSSPPHVVVQLLVSPSLGCAKAQTYRLSTSR